MQMFLEQDALTSEEITLLESEGLVSQDTHIPGIVYLNDKGLSKLQESISKEEFRSLSDIRQRILEEKKKALNLRI